MSDQTEKPIYRSVGISQPVYSLAAEFCQEHGFLINRFVAKAIMEKLERENPPKLTAKYVGTAGDFSADKIVR